MDTPDAIMYNGHSMSNWLAKLDSIVPVDCSTYEMDTIAQHHAKDDAWIVLYGRIYDITPFIKYHPGGIEPLLQYAGRDASLAFGTPLCTLT